MPNKKEIWSIIDEYMKDNTPGYTKNSIDGYTQVRNVLTSPGTNPKNHTIYTTTDEQIGLGIQLRPNQTGDAIDVIDGGGNLLRSIDKGGNIQFGTIVGGDNRIGNYFGAGIDQGIVFGSTGKKISFFGKVPPVTQPTALTASTGTLPNAVTRIQEIEDRLVALGLLA